MTDKLLIDRELLTRIWRATALILDDADHHAVSKMLDAKAEQSAPADQSAPGEVEEVEVVGRRCTPSAEMAAVKAYKKKPWVDGRVTENPSSPGFYSIEPLMTVAQHQRIVAQLQQDLDYFPQTVRALIETISDLRAQLDAAERRDADRIEEIEILQRQLDRFRNQSHGISALAEHERLRHELAERDALLRRWSDCFGHLGGCATPLRNETRALLSSEPAKGGDGERP